MKFSSILNGGFWARSFAGLAVSHTACSGVYSDIGLSVDSGIGVLSRFFIGNISL